MADFYDRNGEVSVSVDVVSVVEVIEGVIKRKLWWSVVGSVVQTSVCNNGSSISFDFTHGVVNVCLGPWIYKGSWVERHGDERSFVFDLADPDGLSNLCKLLQTEVVDMKIIDSLDSGNA